MATEIKAPEHWEHDGRFTIFLAGSIDQGASWDWQKYFVEAMADQDVVLLNPRRRDWDKTWKGTLENPKFVEQVRWEQKCLNESNFRIFVMVNESMSPITLLELGEFIRHPGAISCDPGFYRRGNVQITATLHNMPCFDNIDALVRHTKMIIKAHTEQK